MSSRTPGRPRKQRKRPVLPGEPPRSKSNRRVKPWVVSTGEVSRLRKPGVVSTSASGAAAPACVWKGLWHFSNRPRHVHNFEYQCTGDRDLGPVLLRNGLRVGRGADTPDGSPGAAGAGGGSSSGAVPARQPATKGAAAATTAHSTSRSSSPAASSSPTPAATSTSAVPGPTPVIVSPLTPSPTVPFVPPMDWGVYGKPATPAPPGCPLPSGYAWEGAFYVPSMRSASAQDTDRVKECFVLWVTSELADAPGVFSVVGHGRNEIGRFGFTGWFESEDKSLDVAKVYIPAPRRRVKRKRRSVSPAAKDQRRVSSRKRTLSRRLSIDGSSDEDMSATVSSAGSRGRRRTAAPSPGAVTGVTGEVLPSGAVLVMPRNSVVRASLDAGAVGSGGGAPFGAGRRVRSRSVSSTGTSASRGTHARGSAKHGKRATDKARKGGGTESRAEGGRSVTAVASAKRPGDSSWAGKLVIGANCLYQGTLSHGRPSDNGTCVYQSGLMYEGGWHNGREHGWGVLSDKHDVTLYEGEFADGRLSGVGVYYFPNGDIYEGEWKDSAFHGVGKFTSAGTHGSFEGDWRDGRRHGRGVLTVPGGFSYSGEWAHDAAHGKGTLVMPSGLSYSGVWAAGVFEGRGDCRYSDSSTYQGTFKAGLRDGRGTLTFPNGAVYNGRFREDRLEGSGTLSLTKPVPAEDGTDTLLVPVSLQADLQLVHLRAGFTSKGL